MKQVRFLMVALTLLMGVTFTSCMNGENDPTVGGTFFMKVTSDFPYTFAFAEGDVSYVAVNSEKLMTSDISRGDVVYIAWSYNSDEQVVDKNTKKVNVTVSGVQKLSSESRIMDNNGESYQNATIISLGESDNSMGQNAPKVLFFDKNTLVLPIFYHYEKEADALSKHTFLLVYNESETKADDTKIRFYLRHRNSEDKPSTRGGAYKAFKIEEALEHYKSVTGKKPSSVEVLTKESNKAGSSSLEDAKAELQTYNAEYKFED